MFTWKIFENCLDTKNIRPFKICVTVYFRFLRKVICGMKLFKIPYLNAEEYLLKVDLFDTGRDDTLKAI